MVKDETTPKEAPADAAEAQVATDGGLPLVSMILGIISIAMFMLFLGLPALILGIIGLKKYESNRAFSITGIVTGAISTLIMIALIIFVIFAAFIYRADYSTPDHHPYYDDYNPRMERGGREGA